MNDELEQWLSRVPFSRSRRGTPRDFADAVLVAELVAHFLPRYVDLQHYLPASSAQLKKYNWQTLDKMVLSYLDVPLHAQQIEALVAGHEGFIEPLLMQVRLKIELALSEKRFRPRRGSRMHRRSGSNTSLAGQSDDESNIGTPRRRYHTLARHGMQHTPTSTTAYQDMVPAKQLHEAQAKCYAKEEQITTLQARLQHMQRLVSLKEERIDELTHRLDRLAHALAERYPPIEPPPPTSEEQHAAAATALMSQLMELRSSLSPSTTSGVTESTESDAHLS